MATVRDQRRVGYLDGIRALAVVSVLAVHWASPYLGIGSGGYLGVDVFFVLSGYIITTILWRMPNSSVASSWSRFIWRRVVRLYPALVVLSLVVPAAYAILPHSPESPSQVAFAALIAVGQGSSIYGAQSDDLGPFGHTWSLSVEWYFYVLWALIVFAARRNGVASRTMLLWGASSAAVIYAVSLFQGPEWYYGPVARFPELLVGGAIAFYSIRISESEANTRNRRWNWLGYLIYPALGAYLVYVLIGPNPMSPIFRFVGLPLGVGTAALLIQFGNLPRMGIVRILEIRPITLVGRVSYSLYLWHVAPIALMKSILPGQSQAEMAVVGVVLAVSATAFSYRYLEKPFMRPQGLLLANKSFRKSSVQSIRQD